MEQDLWGREQDLQEQDLGAGPLGYEKWGMRRVRPEHGRSRTSGVREEWAIF